MQPPMPSSTWPGGHGGATSFMGASAEMPVPGSAHFGTDWALAAADTIKQNARRRKRRVTGRIGAFEGRAHGGAQVVGGNEKGGVAIFEGQHNADCYIYTTPFRASQSIKPIGEMVCPLNSPCWRGVSIHDQRYLLAAQGVSAQPI